MAYKIILRDLKHSHQLWSDNVIPLIKKQLEEAGRTEADKKNYRVEIKIVQGVKKPAKDIDNYAKKIIDSITYTGLLWMDDVQIVESETSRAEIIINYA